MPKDVILAYATIDGACAAALVLLAKPKAEIVISSATTLNRKLAEQAEARRKGDTIHVCGLGFHCGWEQIEIPLGRLRENGCRTVWYSGRRHLDEYKERLANVAEIGFYRTVTDAAAVAKHLHSDHPHVRAILAVAATDPRLPPSDKIEAADRETAFWLDFIEACRAQFYKYQIREAYPDAIRKLADQRIGVEDERQVELFRVNGFRYLLAGNSRKIRQVITRIRACAACNDPVLITGESGVGKENAAHLIHEDSHHTSEPFVPVNCAMFAGNLGLANSVLFGHAKGAFTGAYSARRGAFLQADNGTLFLDEIGEMPLEVQAKLLRVLEDGLVFPEGSDTPAAQVSVRILAATNVDLPAKIRARQFREDLFHRLEVLRIHIPPLRERPEDIEPLVYSALRSPSFCDGKTGLKLTAADFDCLRQASWPGNVRQLYKVLKRALRLDLTIREVMAEELSGQAESAVTDGFLPLRREDVKSLEEVKSHYSRQVIRLTNGNLGEAAKLLGVHRNTIRQYARKADPI